MTGAQTPNAPPPRTAEARMAALGRPDKWVLSGLDGIVWAPLFPKWLERPGLWDPAHILHYELGPLFSVALLDASDREIGLARLPPRGDAWQPDRLTTEWTLDIAGSEPRAQGPPPEAGPALRPHGVAYTDPPVATEVRRVLPGGVVESEWRIPAEGAASVVAFTAQPANGTTAMATGTKTVGAKGSAGPEAGARRPGTMSAVADGLSWERTLMDRKGESIAIACHLEIRGGRSQESISPL